MQLLDLDSNELISALLALAVEHDVCILDSCGVGYLDSHLMIAGIEPMEMHEISNSEADETLEQFERLLRKGYAAIFSISYDFGRKLQPIPGSTTSNSDEPDIFVALFDTLSIHDYKKGKSFLIGNSEKLDLAEKQVRAVCFEEVKIADWSQIRSNFTRSEYVEAVELIKEHIRRGDTYQTNLTQQFSVELTDGLNAETIFARLRRDHPAPFSAFLKRRNSTVVSASPERFFSIEDQIISASPIKGTRKRGATPEQDAALKIDLAASEKDRAENTMIVDLLRNDVGRVCEYGRVEVEKCCEIETHPTFHHMVSTINGQLKDDTSVAEILRALFPCGSITGAPKIRTMQIIDEVESKPRGLSMGAIGYFIPETGFEGLKPGFDLSVAIRTMVVKGNRAVFNVGGGITIDSDPKDEYEESMLKAKAIFAALGGTKSESARLNLQIP